MMFSQCCKKASAQLFIEDGKLVFNAKRFKKNRGKSREVLRCCRGLIIKEGPKIIIGGVSLPGV